VQGLLGKRKEKSQEEKVKNYLVWYRLKNEDEDRVRGTARNWQRAEQMAKSLELHLRAHNKPVVSVGVKSGLHGELYHDQDLHMRWSVVPPEPEDAEKMRV